MPYLPADLHLYILALLPPHDLALAGRLACRQAAQRFGSRPHDRTARLSQPLPGHTAVATWCVEGARAAMAQLSLRQKLLLLSTAAASGCEANVEFAWQLLQPHVFPELLHTDHYHELLMQNVSHHLRAAVPNVGPAAVASGLANLLPSLQQRCPGLLDPGRTLEVAARHCDLAGLQTAWEVVGQRLLSSLQPNGAQPAPDQQAGVQGLWRRTMAAAASSAGPDATAKMEWALVKGRSGSSSHVPVPVPEVWGAAAASGNLGRVRWLHEHGLGLSARDALKAALLHADLGTIHRLEEQGGYLPAAGEAVWTDSYGALVRKAAAAARDSAAKLRWLAGRRGPAVFGTSAYEDAAREAARHGNLEALQLIVEQYSEQNNVADTSAAVAALPQFVLLSAAASGSVPTLAWLWQAGSALDASCYLHAAKQGSLPVVRWLLEAGCPRGNNCMSKVVGVWPHSSTPAESGLLAEAVGLLAAAGWPLHEDFGHPLDVVTTNGHPWAIVHALVELHQPHAHGVPFYALAYAAHTGCEATLEALLGMGVLQGGMPGVSSAQLAILPRHWYAFAVCNGDRGTLQCLRRLGVPLERSLVVRLALEEPPAPVPAAALAWVEGQQEPQGGVQDGVQDGVQGGVPAL